MLQKIQWPNNSTGNDYHFQHHPNKPDVENWSDSYFVQAILKILSACSSILGSEKIASHPFRIHMRNMNSEEEKVI
jgi:hypothetical protein